ncbi:MAG TPA: YihY/virulence factor BrkB family protein, partial [candidate division Zixibacteria bacterium]|nr:YihY/virulence factor BrkB family protein [candidate division Zixibacteria bacterium]
FLLMAGLILLVSIVITVVAAIVGNLSVSLFGIDPAKIPVIWNLLFSLVPPALMMAMFTIIYMVGPKTKVFFRSAIGGALLAAILWEISRRGLGWYMSNVAQYNVLYGTLGTLVALLLWVFYSSNIFIVGAEYAAILNERREKKIAMKGSK